MNMRKLAVMLTSFLLLGAAAGADPFELVRQGNAAFANNDFTKALELYEEAEGRITDPGLVAFNKGAALYRLGRFRDAELHYRRSLEDADGTRRARMLYDLGNCLLHQSAGSDAKLLEQALECYRMALASADSSVAADLRHNLELAKLLWVKARANKPKSENPSSSDTKEDPPPKTKDAKTPNEVNVGGKEPDKKERPQPGQKTDVDPGKIKGKPIQTDQAPPPGSNGSLQPVPDREELVPLPPEDTLRHLQRAVDLIQRERREHLKRSSPLPPRGVMDW